MSVETLARLQKPPHQSFLRERFLSTELHRRPKEERNLEENLAALALYVAFGDSFYDAKRPRSNRIPAIESAWMPEMMYRSSDPNDEHSYEWNEFSPAGICFPTNGTTGVVYGWSEFMLSKEIKGIHLEDGHLLYVPENGEKTLISDHHGWVRLVAHDGREWNIDLASHQFMPQIPDNPDGHIRVVMQGLYGHETDPDIPGVNWQVFTSQDDDPTIVRNARSLEYRANPEKSVPIEEYNWKEKGDRIALLIGAMGLESGAQFGSPTNGIALNNDWHPKGFNHKKVREGYAKMEDKLFKVEPSGFSIEEAHTWVIKSWEDEAKLSVEGLGLLTEELIEQCSDKVLLKWATGEAKKLAQYIAHTIDSPLLELVADEAHECLKEEGKVSIELLGMLAWTKDITRKKMKAHPEDLKMYLVDPLRAVDLIQETISAAHEYTTGKSGLFLREIIPLKAQDIAEMIDTIGFSLDLDREKGSRRHWQYRRLYELYKNDNEEKIS